MAKQLDKPIAYFKNGKLVLRVSDELNDDWMKTLEGYKDETKIHEKLKRRNAWKRRRK